MEVIKVNSEIKNQFGEILPESQIVLDNGVVYEEYIGCYSSADLGLGTCRCVSHDPVIRTSLSVLECRELGLEPGKDFDLLCQALPNGLTTEDLEEFCRLSYLMFQNPLPTLRRILSDHFTVHYMAQDGSRTCCWSGPAPGEKPQLVVEHCHETGQVWIEVYYPEQKLSEEQEKDWKIIKERLPGARISKLLNDGKFRISWGNTEIEVEGYSALGLDGGYDDDVQEALRQDGAAKIRGIGSPALSRSIILRVVE